MQPTSVSRLNFSFDILSERYAAALDRIRSWHVPLAPQSRLLAYQDHISLHLRERRRSWSQGELAEWASELRVIAEIVEIVEAFSTAPTAEELTLLHRIAKGPVVVASDSDMTALEAQYELYLRAVAVSGGFDVKVGDPDLRLTYEGVSFPLEAKRPRRLERLDDRLKDGIKQVETKGGHGIVAISVDMLVRDLGRLLVSPSRSLTGHVLGGLLQNLVTSNRSSLSARTERTSAAAILLTLRAGLFLADEQRLSVAAGFLLLGLTNDPTPRPAFTAFHNAFTKYNSRAS